MKKIILLMLVSTVVFASTGKKNAKLLKKAAQIINDSSYMIGGNRENKIHDVAQPDEADSCTLNVQRYQTIIPRNMTVQNNYQIDFSTLDMSKITVDTFGTPKPASSYLKFATKAEYQLKMVMNQVYSDGYIRYMTTKYQRNYYIYIDQKPAELLKIFKKLTTNCFK